MPEATVAALVERLQLEDGDIVFFGADKRQDMNDSLGALRLKVAEMMDMVGEGYAFVGGRLPHVRGDHRWQSHRTASSFTALCSVDELTAAPRRHCHAPRHGA